MVRSMTGFGRGVTTTDDFQLTVEVRSVNHRFLEIHSKFPKEWLEIELMAKKQLSQSISRGKLDISINVKMEDQSTFNVKINWPIIEAYKQVQKELSNSMPLKDKWSMQEILTIENAIVYEKNEIPIEQLKLAFESALNEATTQLIQMREHEGKQLKTFLLQYKDDLMEQLQIIRKYSPQAVEKYRVKLIERMKEITDSNTFDDRILAEVAIFAEKVDISEELDRLESHFNQLVDTLNEHTSIGRKLDFLMQECLREINTIGSKNQSTECAIAVVQSKTLLEKMREQVQNIE
ncbi:MAG TPA: YicC/YloC family endoribonuclease [Ureibacillus sp.]|nr:YicC/YloC family endoribonuclease [Ureibacillus sp.]